MEAVVVVILSKAVLFTGTCFWRQSSAVEEVHHNPVVVMVQEVASYM